jgi:hypothetical protein
MDAKQFPTDQKAGNGFPVERMSSDGETRVFRSGGEWYYQFRGSSECWGPFGSARAALSAQPAPEKGEGT